jgi:hypothetical protein
MLAADAKLANKIVDVAKRRESTVYKTVNDILEQALRADQMGLSLGEIVDEREMLKKAQELGFTFSIEQLLYDVLDLTYSRNSKKLAEMWMETGRWYGQYFKNKSNNSLNAFVEAMGLLSLGNSVFNIEERRGGIFRVTCVGERFSQGFIEVYSLFIEGVFETFDMMLENKENSEGIIRLRFRKR